jgi:hypothetical protein
MHEGENAYYISDTSLVERAESLWRTLPLLTLSPDREPGGLPFRRAVAVTDFGRAVLNGEKDRVAMCSIDRWLGGVHLAGEAERWRWDDTRKTITSMSRN